MDERLKQLLQFIEWREQEARERLDKLPQPGLVTDNQGSEMVRTIREPVIREMTTAMSIKGKLLELFPELRA